MVCIIGRDWSARVNFLVVCLIGLAVFSTSAFASPVVAEKKLQQKSTTKARIREVRCPVTVDIARKQVISKKGIKCYSSLRDAQLANNKITGVSSTSTQFSFKGHSCAPCICATCSCPTPSPAPTLSPTPGNPPVVPPPAAGSGGIDRTLASGLGPAVLTIYMTEGDGTLLFKIDQSCGNLNSLSAYIFSSDRTGLKTVEPAVLGQNFTFPLTGPNVFQVRLDRSTAAIDSQCDWKLSFVSPRLS